ncbi:MAG: pyridoxal phosphate-dependent aminotransferase [Acidobacteria bacterium]|nr:pyridoxal phosphate-dependent aminotransferase [Acidobacteriota bacterium]
MIVAKKVSEQLRSASWIRRMFEEGNRLRQERGAENVFDFTLGNPEVEPPASVLAAARRVLDSGKPHLHAYMPNAGFSQVRERLAERAARATGLPFTANHMLMTVGAGGALNVLFKALLDPGDEVIALAPYFVEYGFYVENHGGRLVVVPTGDDFLPDIDAIARAITPRTRAIIVNSPNNPTGVVYDAGVFERFERLLAGADHPIVLVSDEPYKALVFEGPRPPEVAAIVGNAVVATSWSKALAIPGERIGVIAISPRLPEAAELHAACTFTNRVLGFVNAPALWQWVVAETSEDAIDIAGYREKRDILYEAFTRIGYRCIKPRGAFYMFPASPLADDVAFVRMLAEEGILVVPGTGFGCPGHVRLSLTVPRDTVVRSLPGFERAFRRATS